MAALLAQVASIDHDLVYWGLGDPVPVESLKPGDRVFGSPELKDAIAELALDDVVYIEKTCDLPSGRFKLMPPDDGNPSWHFDPLPTEQQKAAPGAPTLEQAVYDLIVTGTQAPRVQAWAKWFQSTPEANA